MIEKPAKGIRGLLLKDFFTHRSFFRVYGEFDAVTGDKPFVDYKIRAEDIEVTIEEGDLSLYEYENEDNNKLDWSSKTLGIKH